MRALLIAGPLTLDAAGLFAGDGVIAAAAAAPFSPTQLWAQGGTGIDHYRRGLLTKRGVDDAGIDWTGATPTAAGPFLPAAEPTDAENVGAALVISVAPDEAARARRVLAALPGADTRPVLVAPRPGDLTDAATRRALIAGADLAILPLAAAQRALGNDDPLAVAQALRDEGAHSVALCAGALGGLLLYRNLAVTWPAAPAPGTQAGARAAFAGVVAAWVAGTARADLTTLKRGCGTASAVGALQAQGGAKALFGAGREELLDRFHRLRRTVKA